VICSHLFTELIMLQQVVELASLDIREDILASLIDTILYVSAPQEKVQPTFKSPLRITIS
jgi:hypothetical protein